MVEAKAGGETLGDLRSNSTRGVALRVYASGAILPLPGLQHPHNPNVVCFQSHKRDSSDHPHQHLQQQLQQQEQQHQGIGRYDMTC